jgi:hypothetical protein
MKKISVIFSRVCVGSFRCRQAQNQAIALKQWVPLQNTMTAQAATWIRREFCMHWEHC